jgi:hypothetical protein
MPLSVSRSSAPLIRQERGPRTRVRCQLRHQLCERDASGPSSNGVESRAARTPISAQSCRFCRSASGGGSGYRLGLQAGGHRFDPGTLHDKNSRFAGTFGLNGAGADNSGASGASAQCRFVSARCWRRRSSVSRQPSSGRVNEPACHAEFARSSPGRSGKDGLPVPFRACAAASRALPHPCEEPTSCGGLDPP